MLCGTLDVASEEFMIAAIRGAISAAHSLTNQVCTGSSPHDLDGELLINLRISVEVAGTNDNNFWPLKLGSETVMALSRLLIPPVTPD